MAPWQVEFALVPRRAIASAPADLRDENVLDADWWADSVLPSNYAARIATFAEPGKPWADDVQTWGAENGNRIDVWSDDDSPRQVHLRIDVRKLDAKFAAGLLAFAKAAGAVLVRSDGWVVEPTVNGLSVGIRTSNVWRDSQTPLDGQPGAFQLPPDEE